MKKNKKGKRNIISSRDMTDPLLKTITGKIPLAISPNMLTGISFFLALISAYFFWFSGIHHSFIYLFLAGTFLVLSSSLDALDGALARIRKIESKWGDYLDHSLDRVVDAVLLLSISLGGHVGWKLMAIALVGVSLTSNFGTLSKSIGLSRDYGGLGRFWRLVILILATFLNSIYWEKLGVDIAGIGSVKFSFLGWAVVIFAIGGIYTASKRFLDARRSLTKSNKAK